MYLVIDDLERKLQIMIRFKISTYEFKPIKEPAEGELFEDNVNWEESIARKQEIFGSFFNNDSKLKFKRSNNQTYDHLVVAQKVGGGRPSKSDCHHRQSGGKADHRRGNEASGIQRPSDSNEYHGGQLQSYAA